MVSPHHVSAQFYNLDSLAVHKSIAALYVFVEETNPCRPRSVHVPKLKYINILYYIWSQTYGNYEKKAPKNITYL